MYPTEELLCGISPTRVLAWPPPGASFQIALRLLRIGDFLFSF